MLAHLPTQATEEEVRLPAFNYLKVPTLIIKRRIALLFFLTALSFIGLTGRIAFVQIFKNDELFQKALDQRMRPFPVYSRRGIIYDRNMEELAISVSGDAVYAIPVEVKEPKLTAKTLAEILNMEYSDIYNRIIRRTATVWIDRKLTDKEAEAIRTIDLPGIKLAETSQRFYPNNELAAHILGIAGMDNQGLEGLELYYDKYLRGAPGQVLAERDAKGKEIPEGLREFLTPQDGNNLILTIDKSIQYIVERELDKVMEEVNAARGGIIVMDPKTGDILAMASRPTYDPNTYNEYPNSVRRNFVLTDSYEPGSTFKVITSAAALEEGLVTPLETFFDPGYILVEDRRLRCWRGGGHGSQTFIEAAENSCNVVFVTIGMRLAKEKFYEYIKDFGFGARTGIDFPGEASGILMPLKNVGPVEQGTISFGQGIAVTPLQLVTAVAAVANDGLLMKPRLVKAIRDSEGNIIEEFPETPLRQVISEDTAKTLQMILESVVLNGSGRNAGIAGYRVAGKTGTAQKAEDGRYGSKRVVSFVGFAPVDDPRIAAIVVLDEPNAWTTFASVLAAPSFRELAYDTLQYLGIEPDPFLLEQSGKGERKVAVPQLIGLSLEDAQRKLTALGLKSKLSGTGELVVEQLPPKGVMVPIGSTVLLTLGSSTSFEP